MDTIGDCIADFLTAHGKINNRVEGSISALMDIGGKERLCGISFNGNPIRGIVFAGEVPEDADAEDRFSEILLDLDVQSPLTSHIVVIETGIFWFFDLILADGSLEKQLEVWLSIAQAQLPQIDDMLACAEGKMSGGKYQFPINSTLRH